MELYWNCIGILIVVFMCSMELYWNSLSTDKLHCDLFAMQTIVNGITMQSSVEGIAMELLLNVVPYEGNLTICLEHFT